MLKDAEGIHDCIDRPVSLHSKCKLMLITWRKKTTQPSQLHLNDRQGFECKYFGVVISSCISIMDITYTSRMLSIFGERERPNWRWFPHESWPVAL